MTLLKIISGGQTGVDQAALRAAKAARLPTGGWAPKHWQTEDGPAPWLCGYGLLMHTGSYAQRTRANVALADRTLILYVGKVTRGTALTAALTQEFRKPGMLADLDHADLPACACCCRDWIVSHGIKTLNVAGPRESKHPGIGARAEAFLALVFAALKESP